MCLGWICHPTVFAHSKLLVSKLRLVGARKRTPQSASAHGASAQADVAVTLRPKSFTQRPKVSGNKLKP